MAARPSLFIPGAAQPASLRAIAAAPNAPYPNSARPRRIASQAPFFPRRNGCVARPDHFRPGRSYGARGDNPHTDRDRYREMICRGW